MTTPPADAFRYRIGIDVGTHSVGLAAIQFDALGRPVKVLSAMSWLHDSGVLEAKTATTRLAASGVARRVRRMRSRRVKRLRDLDQQMADWGWVPLADDRDPYQAWRARARLATEVIDDPTELHAHLATAVRHMARHRGWRNPYTRVESLLNTTEPSGFLGGVPATEKAQAVSGFKQRVESRVGVAFGPDVTVAELAVAAIDHDNHVPLRMGKTENRGVERDFSYLSGKLMQSDNANEIHAYARVQRLKDDVVDRLIALVFAAESPRGSWVSKVGKDPLNQLPRASKATDSFQRFRIVSTLANVRVKDESGAHRALTRDELVKAYEYLVNRKPSEQPTWGEVAEVLERSRRWMSGVASTGLNGEERLPARPPVHHSDHVVRAASKLPRLKQAWIEGDRETRDALVQLLTENVKDESTQAGAVAMEVVNALDEDELMLLDGLDFPAGRAAYSLESLRALTEHMLATGEGLHEARKAIFGVDDSWTPPADPIGAPVGNPAVDRVLKIVARYLEAAQAEWGSPESVTIEHVRDAFRSAAAAKEAEDRNKKRFAAKLQQRESIGRSVNSSGRIRESDVRRFQAIQRQNGQCLYCGDSIDYATAEMDHVVPRRGPGSTNTRSNLVAVCVPCNRSKSNTPFATWASSTTRPGVSVTEAVKRSKFWLKDQGETGRSWSLFLKEVRDRLERTEEDPEIDARSMESVAWMANELRERISASFARADMQVDVRVYRGALTAEARRASHMENQIPWIGGVGKTRLDRRHHAVDAAVQTLLDPSVARTLAERMSMRTAQFATKAPESWKTYAGSGPAAVERYTGWLAAMDRLTGLLVEQFEQDRVVVRESLRLRLGNGRAHEDTVRPAVRKQVGEAFSLEEVDAASTPQLWTALTRDPDFDQVEGLPANTERTLRLQRTWLSADDEVALFDKPRAAVAVRNGWAALGDSVHHARIYRWEERGKTKYGMLRVFAVDLQRHRNEDLFSVEPQPSWISMRTAHPSMRSGDLAEREYVGWLVPGDELLLDMSDLLSGHVGVASQALGFGTSQRWQVTGFMSNSKISMVPLLAASEGLPVFLTSDKSREEAKASLDYVFKRWVSAVDPLFTKGRPAVVRRDSLGRVRLQSQAGLPTSWTAR